LVGGSWPVGFGLALRGGTDCQATLLVQGLTVGFTPVSQPVSFKT